jgi:hypothetical protein
MTLGNMRADAEAGRDPSAISVAAPATRDFSFGARALQRVKTAVLRPSARYTAGLNARMKGDKHESIVSPRNVGDRIGSCRLCGPTAAAKR